jgi:hypothetical protein
MLSNFHKIYAKIGGKSILIVLDEIIYPKWRKTYTRFSRYPCSEKFIYKLAVEKLWQMNKYITEDELEYFEKFEAFLAKLYPQLFKYKLGIKYRHEHNEKNKQNIEKDILYLIGVIQTQLTQKSIIKVFEIILSTIQNLNNVYIYEYEPIIKGYEAAEISQLHNGKILLFSKKFINSSSVFVSDFEKKYYCKGGKKYSADENNIKRKIYNDFKFSTLFDYCKDEMNVLLDINNINTFHIFSDVKRLYAKNKLSKNYIRNTFEVEYDSELEKETYVPIMVKLIENFNEIYAYNIKF